MFKKFFAVLGMALFLSWSALTSVAPAMAEECKFPQTSVEQHFSKGERQLWALSTDKIKIFLNAVNQIQKDNIYDADTILFSVAKGGTGQMYILFFKDGCANGTTALVIDGGVLFSIFNQLGIRDTDFKRHIPDNA